MGISIRVEGVKTKKSRSSDDAGGKSVSEMSKSTGGNCVCENSTGVKPSDTRTSNNPFKTSRCENDQYLVDVVDEKPRGQF